MANITRYHSKLYMRKLSFLSFCRFAETDKNDNSDKTDIGHVFAGGSATILATCSDLADFPRAILLQFPIHTMILLCDYYDITMLFKALHNTIRIPLIKTVIKTEKGLPYSWKGFLRIVTF